METRVSLLEMQLRNLERDAEKREKVQDARHAETMAKLSTLENVVSAGNDFSRGVKATVKAAWAIFGGVFVAMVVWVFQRGTP